MRVRKVVKGRDAVLPIGDGFWALQKAPVNGLVLTNDMDTRGLDSLFITESELKEAGYIKRRLPCKKTKKK